MSKKETERSCSSTKDRPRKKDWKREYERAGEPGRYRDDIGSGSLLFVEREDSPVYNKTKQRQ